MSIKLPKNARVKPGESTDFQLHKSQQTIYSGSVRTIVDFTEYRLKRYIKSVTDDQQKLTLKQLLSDYIAGRVAIAWKRGQPIWIKISKD